MCDTSSVRPTASALSFQGARFGMPSFVICCWLLPGGESLESMTSLKVVPLAECSSAASMESGPETFSSIWVWRIRFALMIRANICTHHAESRFPHRTYRMGTQTVNSSNHSSPLPIWFPTRHRAPQRPFVAPCSSVKNLCFPVAQRNSKKNC